MRAPFSLRVLALGALSAALVGPAAAQDDRLRPVDDGPIRDLEGWLDEAVPDTGPAPGAGADPLQPAPAPAPAPAAEAPRAPAPEPRYSPEEQSRRDRQIKRNYDEAQDIYQGIIDADPLQRLDRRIANNERIVREYTTRLRNAAEERRQLQVQLYNKTFYLKQQLDQGQITREAYERMISEEERKFDERSGMLKQHAAAWRQELQVAQQRLNELKSQRRMLEAQRPRRLRGRRGQRDADRPRPGEKLYGTLRGRLEKLGKFQTRNTLDRTHPRSLLGGGLRVGRVQPFGGASRRADPFDANDTVRADPFLEETTPRAGARYDDDVFLDGSPSGRGW